MIATAIAMLLAAGMSGMFLVVGARQYRQQRRLLATAMPVRATVVSTSVRGSVSADSDPSLQRNTSTTTWEPVVEFRYVVDGRSHVGTQLRASTIVETYASAESARARIAHLAPGQVIDVFVSRAFPDQAFLTREASLGPIVFLALGVAIPGIVWAFARLAL